VRREQKEREVGFLSDKIKSAKSLVFAEYKGLKVSEMNDLRSKLRKEDSEIKVLKNRLMKRAIKNHGLDSLSAFFTGPTAMAFSDGDPVLPAKILASFAKDHDKLLLKGGYVEGKALTQEDIIKLSKMASREELLARALSSLMAPATNMACVLSAVPRGLVCAINAIKEKKE